MLQQQHQQSAQGFAPYASPLPPHSGLGGGGYGPAAPGQLAWQQQVQAQPQAPGRPVSVESGRPLQQPAARGLSMENSHLRQFSADVTPSAPSAAHRPGQQAQPMYQQPGAFGPGPGPGPAGRMGGAPNPYQNPWPTSLGNSGPFAFLPGVHNSQLLQPQAFAFDAIHEDPRGTAAHAGGGSAVVPSSVPAGAGESASAGHVLAHASAASAAPQSVTPGRQRPSQTPGQAGSISAPSQSQPPHQQQQQTQLAQALQQPQTQPPQSQPQPQPQPQQDATPPVSSPGQTAPALAAPGVAPAALPSTALGREASQQSASGGTPGPEADRAAKRRMLCQQAFLFVDAQNTGYIDMSQNKTGLTMVFEQLGDVPMPKDEWYVRVFRNFVRGNKELLDFKGFLDIVVQWDEHYLKKRRQKAMAAQAAQTTEAASPSDAQRVEQLPPPPPRGDSLHSVRSANSTEALGALEADAGGSAPSSGPASRSQAKDESAKFESAVEGSWRSAPGRNGGASTQEPSPQTIQAQSALLLPGLGSAGDPPRNLSTAESDCAPSGASRSSVGGTKNTAADIVSEVMFPTYVGRLQIFDDYEFCGDVGAGSFGKVMVVRHKHTKQLRACKVVTVETALQRELIDTEIKLLKSLNHPNIMKMHEVYYAKSEQDASLSTGNIYLVTELCEGGDLFSRILHHYEYLKLPMTESHVAFMMRQILSATQYCHDKDIIHRDIKPENILFVDRSSSSALKIIDFGLADFSEKIREQAKEVKVPRSGLSGRLAQMLPAVNGKHLIPWHERKRVMQKAGTPHYMAPEMIEGNYDLKADIFSIGIILCQLFTGWHPFYSPGDDEQAVHSKIRATEPVQFPRDVWEPVSREAQDLCRKMLEKCPRNRLTASEALAHPWFRDPTKPSPFGNVSGLSVSIFDGLMQYQAYNKLKRAVLQLLTRELSEFQIQELRKKFMALDKGGDGLLSPEELVEGMRHVGYEMSGAELEQIMSALDGTGRQRIGYKEFISALIERRVKFDRQQLAACFKRLDAKGTGRISFDDVKGIMSPALTESEWQEIASLGSQAGESRQAEITFEQFLALMEHREA